ncbi:MAG: DUF1573 domain-containing protein [Pedobacter sp.]|nr:MAG: DUF1573 domain-containing protein [Pedobacter sp.]
MKKMFFVAFAALSLAACQNDAKKTEDAVEVTPTKVVAANVEGATIVFENDTYNFGKIKKGEIVTYTFKFKNSGQQPLIIKDAIATCGCTVPEIPKEPIKPGENGELKVVFNSTGKPAGTQDKAVTVTSNAINNPVSIRLTGEITE